MCHDATDASLNDLAQNEALADRFIAALASGGTLMSSWANVIDLAGPLGRSKEKAQALLDRVGPRWLPLAFNPWQVSRRELGEEAYECGPPVVSDTFVTAFVKERMSEKSSEILDSDTMFRLGRVIDFVHAERNDVLADLDKIKQVAAAEVADAEAKYRADASVLDQRYPKSVYRPEHRVTFVLRETIRTVVCESKGYRWSPNDATDMPHAIMAIGSADIVALDKNWKRRMLPIAQQIGVSLYYSVELPQLVSDLEARIGVGSAPTPAQNGVPDPDVPVRP